MTDVQKDDEKTGRFCSRECSLITVCILQLVATLERLVFDFLGYMWAPIATGFLNIVFILFGIFGAHQYRPKLLIAYAVWLCIWLVWNVFVIFLYLEVGTLSLEKHSFLLNFGTSSESWWYENGFGCNVTYNITTTKEGRVEQTRVSVEGCFLDYRYVEVIHAAVHIILAVMGVALTFVFLSKLNEEEDTFDFIGGFDSSYTVHNSHAPRKSQPVQLQPIYAHRDVR